MTHPEVTLKLNNNNNNQKLTKVLSAKLSIQDHNICKLIAGQLFKEGILEVCL
jgi:hypothetical protein